MVCPVIGSGSDIQCLREIVCNFVDKLPVRLSCKPRSLWCRPMRRFVVVGQRARSDGDFLLADIPSTSGRADVLLRALRAALLISHSVRRDTVVYLLLLGSPDRVRTVRIEGAASRYLRPDERSLATTLKKALLFPNITTAFSDVRPGIAVAADGLACVLPELEHSRLFLLEPGAADVRGCDFRHSDNTFLLGDHLGLEEAIREQWLQLGAQRISVGPVALYTEDTIALVANELDRHQSVSNEAHTSLGCHSKSE
jgi:tRNA (pseudouridine54-N1)-methyltransferase